MRRNPSQLILAVFSLMCVVALIACGSSTPKLQQISVLPSPANIAAGTTQAFQATGHYSDSSTQDVTSSATWSSSDTSIATITSAGIATGIKAGTVTITATLSGIPGTASLTVTQQLVSIDVTPHTASVGVGGKQQYTATGTYQSGPPQDITGLVTWHSSDTTKAGIDTAGLATALVTGTTTITASLSGITSNNATLTVLPPTVVSIMITPGANPIAIGNSTVYTALEVLSDNSKRTPVGTVTWTASNCSPAAAAPKPAAASVVGTATNGTAVANGALAGSCVITATDGAFQNPNTLTVVAGKSHFAYVSNSSGSTTFPSGSITGYTVDATTTTPFTLPVNVGALQPVQTIVHPNGKWLYSIDGASKVHIYDNASGALTLRSGDPGPSAGAGGPNKGVIDPTGQFMYVTDGNTPSVIALTIDQTTGLLTIVQTITTNLGAPEDVIVDRQGKYVYVVDNGLDQVNGYSILASPTPGQLAPLSTPNWTTGTSPFFSAINPTNTFLYVANGTSNNVSIFPIGATGLLNGGTNSTALSGATAIINVAVDPSGKYLYALDAGDGTSINGTIYGFNLNNDGSLGTALAPATITTGGLSPIGLAIDATGALVASENNDSNAATSSIALFKITTGNLTADTAATTGPAPIFVTFLNAP